MKAIAAMASNRTIGLDGKLPWRIKGDLQFFKKMTMGCRCVVGRKTFVSLPKLEGRTFTVITRDLKNLPPHAEKPYNAFLSGDIIDDLGYGDDTWLIGGAEMYRSFLPECTDLYLTRIFKSYEGDTFFPSFEHMFTEHKVIESTNEYAIVHYRRNGKKFYDATQLKT